MTESATMHVGPLGSTIHVLRADADTIAEFAAIDWNRHFRRVCLDPVLGLIVLMAPSHLHEDLTDVFDRIVDIAGSALTGASKALRHTRLRRPGDPPGTGMEPDAAFYLGERARGFRDALVAGGAAAEDYILRTAPDLVVEAEITRAAEGKIVRYADLGVRELWRLHGQKGSRDLRAEFLALTTGRPPRALVASEALPGLTPDDVCEVVEGDATQPDRHRADGGGCEDRPAASTRQRPGPGERPASLRLGFACPGGGRRHRPRARRPGFLTDPRADGARASRDVSQECPDDG